VFRRGSGRDADRDALVFPGEGQRHFNERLKGEPDRLSALQDRGLDIGREESQCCKPADVAIVDPPTVQPGLSSARRMDADFRQLAMGTAQACHQRPIDPPPVTAAGSVSANLAWR